MSLLQRCGGILAHSSWQNCCNSATLEGFRACTAFLRSCHSISVGFRSDLATPKSSFCFSSAIQRWVCWGVLDHCPVLLQNPSSIQLEVTNRWPDIVLQGFLVDSRIHGSIYHSKSSRSWSSKTAPDHHTTTTIFYCWYSFSEMLCYFYTRCDTISKKFNFYLVSLQSIFPKVLGIIKMFSGKTETILCAFCSAAVFVLETGPFLPSLFLTVESWTLTLTDSSEACSSLDVVVRSFVTSWMSRRCTLGVILVGRPILGRFTTVPCFCHLWKMALIVVRWSPKAIEMAL